MKTLLLTLCLYLGVGLGEWCLALRRTLALTNGHRLELVSLVFTENLLGLWVLSNFARDRNWLLALAYCIGGALGALIVSTRKPSKETAP